MNAPATLNEDDLRKLVAEANRLHEDDPNFFEPPGFNQPPGIYVTEATELLGEDAPWWRIAHVAHVLRNLAEEE
jgi:hypothetical protein